MLKDLFKLISCKVENIPEWVDSQETERAAMRPDFLIPFQEKPEFNNAEDIIGRDQEIEDILTVLASDSNGNVLLLGFPGVGKTVLATLIAKRFAEQSLDPLFITGRPDSKIEVVYLNAEILKSGKAKAEEKLIQLQEYLERYPDTIIYVDEAHLLG